MILDLYPEATDEAHGWALFAAAEARARELGGESLAGWEILLRSGARETIARVLSDLPDRLPESIAKWMGLDPATADPGGECRTLVLELPGPTGPELRTVYETRTGAPGTGERIARALNRGAFVGLRPPSLDYWAGLPVAPGRPQDAPTGPDDPTGV